MYNAGAKKCEPKCGAGYSLSNGACVKWKCETVPSSTSPGQCSGTYEKGNGYVIQGKKIEYGIYCVNFGTYDRVLDICCESDTCMLNPFAERRGIRSKDRFEWGIDDPTLPDK